MSDAARWAGLSADEREQTCWQIGLWTELHFSGEDEHGPLFVGEDRSFRLVLGQTVRVGWKPQPLALTDAQRARWPDAQQAFAQVTARPRSIDLPTMLVQVDPDPVYDALEELDEDGDTDLDLLLPDLVPVGFRLLTADEWEALARAGARTVFPWGDAWPSGSPVGQSTRQTPWGHRFEVDPYHPELVRGGFMGGDGGTAACGGATAPQLWSTLACAYRPPSFLYDDLLEETLEGAVYRLVRPAAALSTFLD